MARYVSKLYAADDSKKRGRTKLTEIAVTADSASEAVNHLAESLSAAEEAHPDVKIERILFERVDEDEGAPDLSAAFGKLANKGKEKGKGKSK